LAAAKPIVLSPKWRLVAGGQNASVVASDRYTAMLRDVPASNQWSLTLIDEQTGKRTALNPPSCTITTANQSFFGGPWLMVDGCDLYNLDSGQWTSVPVSPQCPADAECTPVAVGRYWIKLAATTFEVDYGETSFYLQNISTGQFISDPASPGGTVYDDLNAPSGSSPLCPPLRYPTSQRRDGSPIIGTLNFYGPGPTRFAINHGSDRLYRCQSRLNVSVDGTNASSRVVGIGNRIARYALPQYTLALLPGLQRYTVSEPANGGIEAVTSRFMYAMTDDARLYSAPIPTARQIRACARYQDKRRRPRTNPCRYNR
jgi:hypothetical protein